MVAPKLIVFEGVDAAGKSSVTELFTSILKDRKISAKSLSFPGREPRTIGSLVYELHRDPPGKDVDAITPLSLQALHIAAHLDAIESVIIPALANGETVVLDRYWWSTWVYGAEAGADTEVLEALIDAERKAWGQWQPDMVFLVRRSSPLRPEPLDTWKKLSDGYELLASRESGRYPIHTLDNEVSIEATVSEALRKTYGK